MSKPRNRSIQIVRDWTPRRYSGEFREAYCSPACGADCGFAAFERATSEAKLLAARMGEGWEAEVWENFGWHFRANRGVASVAPHIEGSALDGHYSITEWSCSVNSVLQAFADAKTPEDALGLALQDARTAARRIDADCTAISE